MMGWLREVVRGLVADMVPAPGPGGLWEGPRGTGDGGGGLHHHTVRLHLRVIGHYPSSSRQHHCTSHLLPLREEKWVSVTSLLPAGGEAREGLTDRVPGGPGAIAWARGGTTRKYSTRPTTP